MYRAAIHSIREILSRLQTSRSSGLVRRVLAHETLLVVITDPSNPRLEKVPADIECDRD
jgi:hypothetical protein